VAHDLPADYSNFPRNVVRLISEHFGYQTIQFCPFVTGPLKDDKPVRKTLYNNFVSKNISSAIMKRYNDYYAKRDIFVGRSLPSELKSRKVLVTQDVMSPEAYEKTEHCEFLQSFGVYYEMRVFLKHEGRDIAALALYRRKEEGDFPSSEIRVFEYLSDLLSRQLVMAARLSLHAAITWNFDLFFQDVKLGAVLLDKDMTVLRSNAAARAHADEMLAAIPSQSEYFMDNLSYLDEKDVPLQRLIAEIGRELIDRGFLGKGNAVTNRFQFLCKRFPTENILGSVDNAYLVFIIGQDSTKDEVSTGIMESLTSREKDVLAYLVGGLDNNAIAAKLNVSIYTVRTHVANIYRKFDVNGRVALLLKLKNR